MLVLRGGEAKYLEGGEVGGRDMLKGRAVGEREVAVEIPLAVAVPGPDSLLKSPIPNDALPSPKLPGSPYPTAPFGNECC